MDNITFFVCRKCNADFRFQTYYSRKRAAEKGDGLCANCAYFESIGVHTIAEYNDWLKKNNLTATRS